MTKDTSVPTSSVTFPANSATPLTSAAYTAGCTAGTDEVCGSASDTGAAGLQKVEVFVKGPGSGRETAIRSLQAAGLEILSVKDVTPQAHNGVRPRKRRRV